MIRKLTAGLALLGLRGTFAWLFATRGTFRTGRLLPLYIKERKQPVWMRYGTSDKNAFWQIFIQEQYACALACLPDHPLIVDCGANVGYTSLYFLSRYPNAQVIAVEPDPANFELCSKNLAQYEDRVTLVQSAIWARAQTLELVSQQLGNEWGIRVTPSAVGAVQSVTMPQLLTRSGRYNIDLLKIDIEGAEAFVFADDCDWLENVKALAIELHGPRPAKIFWKALRRFDYAASKHGELTLCERIRAKAV